jgi:hypothetical protein
MNAFCRSIIGLRLGHHEIDALHKLGYSDGALYTLR